MDVQWRGHHRGNLEHLHRVVGRCLRLPGDGNQPRGLGVADERCVQRHRKRDDDDDDDDDDRDDTTSPPALTRVGQSHPRWREGTELPIIASVGPPVGTTFRFTVNESVAVRLVFNERLHGHNKTRGKLSFSATHGAHSVRFQGRLSKHNKLPTGPYTLLITVTGANGKTATATLKFTIVKG